MKIYFFVLLFGYVFSPFNGISQGITISPSTSSYICVGNSLAHFRVVVQQNIATNPQQIHLSSATKSTGVEDLLSEQSYSSNMRNIVVQNYLNSIQNFATIDFDIQFDPIVPSAGEGFAIAGSFGTVEFVFKNIGAGVPNTTITLNMPGDSLYVISSIATTSISFPALKEGNGTIYQYAIVAPKGWGVQNPGSTFVTSDGTTPIPVNDIPPASSTLSFNVNSIIYPTVSQDTPVGNISIYAITTCGNTFLKSIPIILEAHPICFVCATPSTGLSLSPNPSTSHINISMKSEKEYRAENPSDSLLQQRPSKIISYKLYNNTGKLIKSSNNTENNNLEINTSDLQQGIYYINVLTNKGMERHKFFKQ